MNSASFTLIGLLAFTISSCTGQNDSGQYGDPNPYGTNTVNDQYQNGSNMNNAKAASTNASYQESDNVVMQTIMDSKTNRPFAQIPLPASWKIQPEAKQGSPSIVGPNGIEVYSYGFQSFMYTNDQWMQQAYQSAGQKMRRPAGIENIMNQDIAQMAKSNGMKFVKQYPLPQVAQADKSYMDQLYKVGQQQTSFQAAGSEWVDNKGNKAIIVVHYSENAGQGSVFWGYYVQVLGSEETAFERAKNAYLNGLVNTRYDRQHIMAYNQHEAAKSNQSWAAHNQKMQTNQSNFEAQQRAHQSSVDSWNKSSMDAYNSRSASQDRMQSQTVNSINETQNVTDPSNGQTYQVEGYSNQYWMNGQGEYIPSDNSLYNPNLDSGVNNQYWEEAPVSPY